MQKNSKVRVSGPRAKEIGEFAYFQFYGKESLRGKVIVTKEPELETSHNSFGIQTYFIVDEINIEED